MPGALLLLAALASPPRDLAAIGVVIARRPEQSVVLLRSGPRTRLAGVGETAFGGRVTAIGLDTVRLEYETGVVEVPLRAVPLPPPRVAGGRPRPTEPVEDPTAPARAMNRREVERRLSLEIPRILAETAVMPVTQDGRVAGLALTRIPEGSLLTDAGLRPGDVLTRINDTVIDGLPTLMSLYPRLQSETEVRAVVLRNGQPVSLTLTLR
jgi:type II secretion system protein C